MVSNNLKNIFITLLVFSLTLILFSSVVSADLTTQYPYSCCVPDAYHLTSNYNPNIGNPFDTLTDCIFNENPHFLKYCFDHIGSGDFTSFVWNPLADNVGCCCYGSTLQTFQGMESTTGNLVTEMACNAISNTVFYERSRTDVCNPLTECSSNPEAIDPSSLTLSGNVFGRIGTEEKFELEGAIIELSSEQKPITSTGTYEFTDLIQNEIYAYDVFLNNDAAFLNDYPDGLTCYPDGGSITLIEDTIRNFTLVCGAQVPGCIANWTITGYGPCESYGTSGLIGRRLVYVEDLNECNQINTQIPTIQECSLIGDSCGDGVANETLGEQCDGDDFLFPPTSTTNPLTCNDIYFGYQNTNPIGCTDFCKYDLTMCTGTCDGICTGQDWECNYCPDDCDNGMDVACQEDCSDVSPYFMTKDSEEFSFINDLGDGTYEKPLTDIFQFYDFNIERADNPSLFPGVSFEVGTKDITLNWDYNSNCTNKLYGFKVYMWMLTTQNNHDPEYTQIGETIENTYTFENKLEAGKTYCFDVCARTLDSEEEICTFTSLSVENPYSRGFCIVIEDEECMLPENVGQNCLDNFQGYYGCGLYDTNPEFSNLRQNKTYCVDYKICTENTFYENDWATGAECKAILPCNHCNGLFGLFANYGLSAYNSNLSIDFNCDDSTDTDGLCYKDETLSVSPKFDSCEKINTCYDYVSESSCGSDSCYALRDEYNDKLCEWSSYEDELGVGVCRPIDENKQQCNLCDTNSSLGFCTEKLCEENYGECYYVDETLDVNPDGLINTLFSDYTSGDRGMDLVPSCFAKRNMTCAIYTNVDDCTNKSPALVNEYTNERTHSQDEMNLGTCVWDETNNYCYKNADGISPTLNEDSSRDKLKDDCFDYNNKDIIELCLIDHVPPVTTLDVDTTKIYGANELKFLTINVEDKFLENNLILPSQGYIETYFNFVPKGSIPEMIYPDTNIEDIFVDVDGEYTIYYFSKDLGKNLERIKEQDITIDATGPLITLNPDEIYILTELKNDDIYLSELIIPFYTDWEEVFCSATLLLDDEPIHPLEDIELQYSDFFEGYYTNLPDGVYDYEIICKDDYGNSATHLEEDIIIEGDQSIKNAAPKGIVFADESEIIMSIETKYEATCRYGPLNLDGSVPTYQQMLENEFDTSDNLYHEILFDDILSSYPSKSYIFYTACDFGDNVVTEQDPMDAISFTLDKEAPITYPTHFVNNDYVLYIDDDFDIEWDDDRDLTLNCDDSNNMLDSFGCAEIKYCISVDNFENAISDLILPLTPQAVLDNGLCDGFSRIRRDSGKVNIHSTCKNCYLISYSSDGHNEQEYVELTNVKVRKTEFIKPTLVVENNGDDLILW